MFRTIGDRPSSWELPLPAELLRLPGELARVDALLDDPAFFAPFAPYFHPVLGRPSTPVECYLRLMFLKFRYRLGYESLCAEVSDSVSWRRFCRIGLDGRVPHPTTLLDGWTAVERLLEDLAALEEQVWLVIDDLHELGSAEALRQLELLIMRAPAALRFVLVARRDLRLGLHRLRLAGELTEIRADDLRFSRIEAHAMLNAAGVALSDSALDVLYGRTEGWAAGLRLAALSLAGHPDPERFAAEFGGSERTVAEYLMAEVLERQPEQARQLLLRTSILPRVNGELADLLTGGSGGERVLQQLEGAGAFVISLDARRSWFRYHQLFADLLQLELRGTRPAELPVHELLTRFPAGVIAADAELAARVAGDQLARGSLEEAERCLALATRTLESVPADRRGRAQVILAVVRMRLARQRGDLTTVAGEAQRLLASAVTADPARYDGAGRAGRGPAGAGADRPGHRRGVDRPLRRGEPAPR